MLFKRNKRFSMGINVQLFWKILHCRTKMCNYFFFGIKNVNIEIILQPTRVMWDHHKWTFFFYLQLTVDFNQKLS